MLHKRAITGLAVLITAASAPAARAGARGLLTVSAVVESRCRVRPSTSEVMQARRFGHDVDCDAAQPYAARYIAQSARRAPADAPHGARPFATAPAPDLLVIEF